MIHWLEISINIQKLYNQIGTITEKYELIEKSIKFLGDKIKIVKKRNVADNNGLNYKSLDMLE